MGEKNNSEFQRRAERLPLDVRVRYRTNGSTRWRSGRAVNISRSGVLFRAKGLIQPDAPVDVLLSLPPEISGDRPLNVMCRGYVSRVEPRDVGQVGIGVAIVDFNLLERSYQGRRTREVLRARRRTRELFHRLNNELQILIGTCEVALLNDALPEKTRAQLVKMIQSGRNVAQLIRQINDAGHIERYKAS